MTTGLLAFTLALVASLVITIPVRRFAIRIGMFDLPGPRKIHRQPTPLLGGVAIYIAVLFSLLVFYRGGGFNQMLAVLGSATLLVFVGTLDDRGLLHHQVKLFIAMPLAALIVLASGIRAQVFSVALPGHFAPLGDTVITVLWITGITAAFSILDYMDGVCAGIAAISGIFFAILAIGDVQLLVGAAAAAVAGAAAGFLRWNFSPAKIFLGDGGAMLLGFLLATLALKLRLTVRAPNAAWLVPLFVLAVPILDTSLVSISRLRRGLVPFTSPGKDHLGHRLANSGLGNRDAVLTMYAIEIICGSIAIISTRLTSGQISALTVAAIVALAGAIALLECLPYERQQAQPKPLC